MTTTNEARIESSTKCNYRCTFCPHSSLTRNREIMSFELFEEIINKLPEEIDTITLSGLGEMFLDPNIFDKIKYLKDRDYKVLALTNGSVFTDEKIEKLNDSGIDSLRISIHGLDYVEYKEITGASMTKYSNMNNLLENRSRDIYTIITVDMIEADEDRVKSFVDLYSRKVDLLEIWKVHNWTSWANYRTGERSKLTCGRPFNGPLQIQVDGTINMCCFDYDGQLTIGDLKTQTIEEIFNSDEYNMIKAFHSGEEVSGLLCENCDQLFERDDSVLIYNSKFDKSRNGTLSTTYKEL